MVFPSYLKKTLFKESPKTEIFVEVDALTKNEGDEFYYGREGYIFFVNLIAKKVIYIAEFSQRTVIS